ncbi:unnamed protein product, partial [Cylicostephanus goldi]
YHPDIAGKDQNAQAKFVELTEAYDCLKDPERRRYYDNGISGTGGRYPGDPYTSRDFQQYSRPRQENMYQNAGNPFYSKSYTQQEYERIWEVFNRMRSEQASYDERMRREKERIWDEFARQRAERWKAFHDK